MDEKRVTKRLRYVQPELILGNGLRVPIIDKSEIKREGKEYIRFAIKPTDGFLQKYNLPNKPYYIKDFPKSLVRELEQNVHILRATLVACGWNEELTPIMEWHDALFSEIGESKDKIGLLKAQKFRVEEENRKLKSRPEEIEDAIWKKQMKWKKLHGKEIVAEERKGEGGL